MFSGIVEEIGTVRRLAHSSEGLELEIGCTKVLDGTILGDSISVDGVCLTVAKMTGTSFTANVQPVTARLSTLGSVRAGSQLNLERAVAAGQRLGGHYVQGHVDGTGTISAVRGEGASIIIEISVPPEVMRYVVERGFISIDGASLTVMSFGASSIAVSLVYHTQQNITLTEKSVGDRVNLEADVIAKYVERLVEPHRESGVSMDTLRRAGFL
ncbi:MAG: riboflavin synthase [Chloroflexota bacterium]